MQDFSADFTQKYYNGQCTIGSSECHQFVFDGRNNTQISHHPLMLNQLPVNSQQCIHEQSFQADAKNPRDNYETLTSNKMQSCIGNSTLHSYHNIQSSKIQLTKRNISKTDQNIVCEFDGCGKSYTTPSGLKKHIKKVHSGLAQYPCDECIEIFSTTIDRTLHKIRKHKGRRYQKTILKITKRDNSKSRRHNLKAKKSKKERNISNQNTAFRKPNSLRKNYKCHICQELLSAKTVFYKHLKNHLEKDLKCTICRQPFSNLTKCGYHKVEMHSILRPYQCVLCTESFCTRHDLFIHLENHSDIDMIDDESKVRQKKNINPANINLSTCIEHNINNDQEDFRESFDILENLSQRNCDKNIDISKITESVNNTTQFSTTNLLNDSSNKIILIESTEEKPNQLLTRNYTKYKCKFKNCNVEFTNRFDLKRHTEIHCLIEFVCDNCKRIYHSKNAIKWHLEKCKMDDDRLILLDDDDMDSGPIFCEECKQLFENRKVLQFHHKFCVE